MSLAHRVTSSQRICRHSPPEPVPLPTPDRRHRELSNNTAVEPGDTRRARGWICGSPGSRTGAVGCEIRSILLLFAAVEWLCAIIRMLNDKGLNGLARRCAMNVLDQFKLDGKTARVTGCGRGIGQAMAVALAEAGAGIIGV